MLSAVNIHKKFGRLEVLKGVDLSVNKGDVVAIIGPSGSGKSTLLRCINLLEEADEGSLMVDGEYLFRVDNGRIVYPHRGEAAHPQKAGSGVPGVPPVPHFSVMQNLMLMPMQDEMLIKNLSRKNAICSKGGPTDKRRITFELSGG